ncbi:Glutamate-gated chloride channel alpha [Halotydeus destructor]|nr:Glutamate-gated chloride channel alpha [Halotydeus destructor]
MKSIVIFPLFLSFVSGQFLSSLLPVDYDAQLRPPGTGGPTVVNVSIKVLSIVAVTDLDQSITLDLVYTQSWTDSRLILPTGDYVLPLSLDSSFKSKLWLPNVFFKDTQSSSTMSGVFNPVSEITVDAAMAIQFRSRMTLKFSCPMDLFRYPQDNQVCHFDMLPSEFQVQLVWGKFELKPQRFPKFYLYSHYSENCTHLDDYLDRSCIRGSIKLFRKLGHYVIRVYAPSFLMTITCFLGFWIPILGWPARVAIVVTPMLSIITMQVAVYNDIGISYIVGLHIWMAFCELFAFLSILEYAFAIQWAHNVADKKAAAAKTEKLGLPGGGITFARTSWVDRLDRLFMKLVAFFYGQVDFEKEPTNRNKVDYVCRLVFPTLWMLFVWIYLCVFVWPWLAHNE